MNTKNSELNSGAREKYAVPASYKAPARFNVQD